MVPGELGTFCRVADGVEEATLPALTLPACYAKGHSTIGAGGQDRGVSPQRSGLRLSSGAHVRCEAMEGRPRRRCECGLAGHTVTGPESRRTTTKMAPPAAQAAAFDRFHPQPRRGPQRPGITNLGSSVTTSHGQPRPRMRRVRSASGRNNCLRSCGGSGREEGTLYRPGRCRPFRETSPSPTRSRWKLVARTAGRIGLRRCSSTTTFATRSLTYDPCYDRAYDTAASSRARPHWPFKFLLLPLFKHDICLKYDARAPAGGCILELNHELNVYDISRT